MEPSIRVSFYFVFVLYIAKKSSHFNLIIITIQHLSTQRFSHPTVNFYFHSKIPPMKYYHPSNSVVLTIVDFIIYHVTSIQIGLAFNAVFINETFTTTNSFTPCTFESLFMQISNNIIYNIIR